MRPIFHIIPLLLSVRVLAAAAPSTATAPSVLPERPDLLPQAACWTDLPGDVRYVVLDRMGRPWYEVDHSPHMGQEILPLADVKMQVEQAAQLKAPYIRGAYILLIDSRDRVWFLRHDSFSSVTAPAVPPALYCYDTRAHVWSERLPYDPKPRNFNDPFPHAFLNYAFESKRGVVYFPSRLGVYTLTPAALTADGKERWFYQPFFESNIRRDLYANPDFKVFSRIQFAPGSGGNVLAWARWDEGYTGSMGCWMHDGTQWQHLLVGLGDEKHRGRIRAVAPLGDKKFLVCSEDDKIPAFILDIPDRSKIDAGKITADIARLADPDYPTREDAQRRLIAAGAAAMTAVSEALDSTTDVEALARLDLIAAQLSSAPPDARLGQFRLTKADVIPDLSPLRTEVVVAGLEATMGVDPSGAVRDMPSRYPSAMWTASDGHLIFREKRLEHWDWTDPVSHTTQYHSLTCGPDDLYQNILGEDPAGRLYLVNRWSLPGSRPEPDDHFAIVDPKQKETRLTLPSASYPAKRGEAIALDSTGHLWACLDGKPFLSTFQKGAWIEAALPQGAAPVKEIVATQALAQGALLVVCPDRAFLFDANQWLQFASLAQLIEAKFQRLQTLVDDHAGVSRKVVLRKDAAGNIWTVNPPGTLKVYTGQKWLGMTDTPDPPMDSVWRFFPCEQSARMVLAGNDGEAIAGISDGQIRLQRLPATKADAEVAAQGNPEGLLVDAHGRSFVPANRVATVCFDKTGSHEIEGLRYARCQDRAGRIWFLDHWYQNIAALLPDGTRAVFPDLSLLRYSCVVEDQPDSLWITTACGLSHFAVSQATPTGKLTLSRLQDYTFNIPRDAQGLWLDAEGNLWTISTPSSTSAFLWRLTIKP